MLLATTAAAGDLYLSCWRAFEMRLSEFANWHISELRSQVLGHYPDSQVVTAGSRAAEPGLLCQLPRVPC